MTPPRLVASVARTPLTIAAKLLAGYRPEPLLDSTRSHDPFRQIFDEGLSGKILASSDGTILRANLAMATLLGTPSEDLVGRPLMTCFEDEADQRRIAESVVERGQELRAEMPLHGLDPQQRWGLVAMTWTSRSTHSKILLVQVEDRTAQRLAEQSLTSLALHDELTGLPNRRLLVDRCEQALDAARSGRSLTHVAALFIDLDGFKAVNDRAGHDTGDQLLISIAHDLQDVVRAADTVARIGGDEFVVLVGLDDGVDQLREMATRINHAIRRTIVADGAGLRISASIGIARIDLQEEPSMRPDQLLIRADAAMYHAKQSGGDRSYIYDRALREMVESHLELERAMRAGLSDDRINLVFQPVIDVDTSTVVGAEALMRLHSYTGALLPTLPAVMAAESAGLAGQLSDRVLDLALDAVRSWPALMSIAINISARELTGGGLSGRIDHALERYGIDPRRLVLEVTETSVVDAGPTVLLELEALRLRGVRIAIDDFGTAFATLQNLTRLPVDILKVDASFTAGLPDIRSHSAIVHGIASMALELGIPCIVEGVETRAQRSALLGMGVQAQGWLWGKPQGLTHVPEILRS